MRCPKCQYISFDSGDRCRNCGYEFSLAKESTDVDLPLKTGSEPVGPFSDFALDDVEGLASPPGEPQRTPSAPAVPGGRSTGSSELPLFGDRSADDDAPLVSLPAAPRPPVAVRKSSVSPRPAPQRTPVSPEPELALEFAEESSNIAPAAVPVPTAPRAAQVTGAAVDDAASASARVAAAAIDGGLILAIDAGVLYFTLKVCGLTFAEARSVPIMPFLAFLSLLNGGYMAAFTAAGGQSIGKMAAGIKVVTAEPDDWNDRVPFGQAVLRTVGYLVSALPVGLGFLPALLGSERRAVHDRLAQTRVVKA